MNIDRSGKLLKMNCELLFYKFCVRLIFFFKSGIEYFHTPSIIPSPIIWQYLDFGQHFYLLALEIKESYVILLWEPVALRKKSAVSNHPGTISQVELCVRLLKITLEVFT
jgi:hypothetical protein